jgi:hypothetical protein
VATFGCLVVDRADRRKLYLLCDYTGIAPPPVEPHAGDAILQPGRGDGGNRAADVIATLARWTVVRDDPACAAQNVAAAIAQVRRPRDVSPEIRGRGALRGVQPAQEGAAVCCVGRTSGLVWGRVTWVGASHEVPCPYNVITGGVRSTGDGSGFHPVLFADLIECTAMLQPGDSGAVLLDEENYALGLGFAASSEVSLFLPLARVLDALGVDLVTAGTW